MTLSAWTGGDGDWGEPRHWSAGVPDAASADAAIAAAGAYRVTIGADETFTVGDLTLNAAGATLDIGGGLNLTGALHLAAGTLDLAGGIIHGGRLVMAGGGLQSDFGTLDGVGVTGTLGVTTALSWLTITDGLGVRTASGRPGLIELGGDSDVLEFDGTQTFDAATIVLGSFTGFFGGDSILGAGRLTLGPRCQVASDTARALAIIGGSAVINDGAIRAAAADGLFTIDAARFVNNGTIAVSGRQGTLLADGQAFTNAAGGLLTIGESATAILGGGKVAFDNQGAIVVARGGELVLRGVYTQAAIGAVHSLGLIDLDGALDNAGSMLTLGAGALQGALVLTGVIDGGVVTIAPGAEPRWAGTLDAVAFRGPLDIGGGPTSTLIVQDGLTVSGGDGGSPGVVRIDGADSQMIFAGDQTFDDATVLLGDPAGGRDGLDSVVVQLLGHAATATLTLGPDLRLIADAAGERVSLDEEASGGTIVNAGLLSALAEGGTLVIDPDTFSNTGRLVVGDGDTVEAGLCRAFTNAGLVTVGSGGDFALNSGPSFTFANTGRIEVRQGGTLTVTGAYTLASLGAIDIVGTFDIDGEVDNEGKVMRVGAGPLLGGAGGVVLGINARIEGGTLILGGGPMTWAGGDLKTVAVEGAVDLGGAGARVFLAGGVRFAGMGGAGRGQIELTGAGATLDFLGSQTLDDATISAGHAGSTDAIELFTVEVAPQVVTFGTGMTLLGDVAGSTVTVDDSYASPDTFVNDGVIEAVAARETFSVTVPTFVDNGQVIVADGATFTVAGLVKGDGAFIVGDGALVLGQASSGLSVTFTGAAGRLILTDGAGFAPTLTGLRVGDVIDLKGLSADRAAVNARDQLVLFDGATAIERLQLVGDYRSDSFAVAGDGSGGVTVAVAAPSPRAMIQAMAAFASPTAALATANASDQIPPPPPMMYGLRQGMTTADVTRNHIDMQRA